MLRRFLTATVVLLLTFVVGLAALADEGQDKGKSPANNAKGESKAVTLKVILPEAKAKVTIEGQLTRTTGETRTFRSPPLEPGKKYVYTLAAEWEPNNYTRITRTIKKTVTAGALRYPDPMTAHVQRHEAHARHLDYLATHNVDPFTERWTKAMGRVGRTGRADPD